MDTSPLHSSDGLLAAAAAGDSFRRGALIMHRDEEEALRAALLAGDGALDGGPHGPADAALRAGDHALAATAAGADLGELQSLATAARPGGERARAAAAVGAASLRAAFPAGDGAPAARRDLDGNSMHSVAAPSAPHGAAMRLGVVARQPLCKEEQTRAALGGDASSSTPASDDAGRPSRAERRAARWNSLRSQWSGNGSSDAPNLNQGRRKQRADLQASRPQPGKESARSSPGRPKAPPGRGPLPEAHSSASSSGDSPPRRSPAVPSASSARRPNTSDADLDSIIDRMRKMGWHLKGHARRVDRELELLVSNLQRHHQRQQAPQPQTAAHPPALQPQPAAQPQALQRQPAAQPQALQPQPARQPQAPRPQQATRLAAAANSALCCPSLVKDPMRPSGQQSREEHLFPKSIPVREL